MRPTWVLATVLALGLAACGSTTIAPGVQTRSSPTAHLADGRPAHIAVVVMENHEYGDVIGSSSAPFINRLARSAALATQSYATAHPSLPNYLALTSGSTFGFNYDCVYDCNVPGAGLAGQLEAAGVSWRAYMEDLPRPCFTGAYAANYAKKHDPFVYYRQLRACKQIVPLSQLYADERERSLPTFIWITPNLCNDMHDCDIPTGDRFLAKLLPALLRSLGSNGLLFLTWDEGTTDNGCCRLASGGHIATIVAGGGSRPGGRLNTPVDHYSLLQTIEDLLGLRRLGGAACACTPSLQPLLRTAKP